MQKNQDSRLGTENITKLMISLAIPAVLAQIVNVLYNIVDRIYICLLYTSLFPICTGLWMKTASH